MKNTSALARNTDQGTVMIPVTTTAAVLFLISYVPDADDLA